jgi:hypothetical protein
MIVGLGLGLKSNIALFKITIFIQIIKIFDAGASPAKHKWKTAGRTSAYFEIF